MPGILCSWETPGSSQEFSDCSPLRIPGGIPFQLPYSSSGLLLRRVGQRPSADNDPSPTAASGGIHIRIVHEKSVNSTAHHLPIRVRMADGTKVASELDLGDLSDRLSEWDIFVGKGGQQDRRWWSGCQTRWQVLSLVGRRLGLSLSGGWRGGREVGVGALRRVPL